MTAIGDTIADIIGDVLADDLAGIGSWPPLLADVPNVRGAYSTRVEMPGYSGPLLRVRRADGAEADVYPDASGMLDVAAMAAHCGASAGTVATWYDQSGLANNLTAIVADQPQVWNGAAAELMWDTPALSFAGGRHLRRGDSLGLLGSPGMDIFISGQPTGNAQECAVQIGEGLVGGQTIAFCYDDAAHVSHRHYVGFRQDRCSMNSVTYGAAIHSRAASGADFGTRAGWGGGAGAKSGEANPTTVPDIQDDHFGVGTGLQVTPTLQLLGKIQTVIVCGVNSGEAMPLAAADAVRQALRQRDPTYSAPPALSGWRATYSPVAGYRRGASDEFVTKVGSDIDSITDYVGGKPLNAPSVGFRPSLDSEGGILWPVRNGAFLESIDPDLLGLFSGLNPVTVIVSLRFDDTGTWAEPIDIKNVSDSLWWPVQRSGGSNQGRTERRVSSASILTTPAETAGTMTAQRYRWGTSYDGATTTCRISGGHIAGVASASTSDTRSMPVLTEFALGRGFKGAIDEILIFDRALSGTEIDAVHAELASEYP